ncbi:ankyrin repeat protein, putative [Trypanosoma equiperdum]|uniref:Ankyrin repeat protein, putative n=2 Tax=Trypanozoon TaxID=39700 RepID=Q38DB1_TRYB2|nr:uncharacterized protein Tb09.211.3970 [Trypanosoma brucei brucei TREU927]EAN77209.1 ankyrin repeat protein, putative [Trypanosoma brucei brucei TREU927]SCU64354.1 ankyrin repeat protein, putative [Trypanosoma equiperdum]
MTTGGKQETIYDACRNGNEARVEEYVRHGGSVVEYDKFRMTLLHHAAYSGNIRVVDFILSAQCSGQQQQQRIDLDAADADGWTPLHYAADRGFVSITARLLEEGANVNAKDGMKRTPLHLAATSGRVDVVKLLLSSGAMRGVKNVVGLTALECAKANDQVDTVSVLEHCFTKRQHAEVC